MYVAPTNVEEMDCRTPRRAQQEHSMNKEKQPPHWRTRKQ